MCVCFSHEGQFVYFGVFSLICFELSVPVQVIAWKDFVSEMTCYVSSET